MSTLGETNNAQFFLYLKVVRFIEQRHLWTVNGKVLDPLFTFNLRRYLQEPKTLLKTH